MEQAVVRIIDANFNRAREAARVIEEFCRFSLNNSRLTERAKQLRHELSAEIGKLLPEAELISGRDTPGDVGCGMEVENQLRRSGLRDCVVAAAKRLTEALRVLGEMTQSFNSKTAGRLEKLRYKAYTLEKDVLFFCATAERYQSVRLYVIVDGQFPCEAIKLARNCAQGGADCIQLRAKNIPDDQFLSLAKEIVGICREFGLVSIINDRVDIAAASDADGVHLGQDDLPVAEAGRLVRKPMIFGKTTHSIDQLNEAISQQVTYVSVGPVFKSSTKPDVEVAGMQHLSEALKLLEGSGIGHAVIGGVTLENIDQILKAGAKTVAVCSAIAGSGNPQGVCCEFKRRLLGNRL